MIEMLALFGMLILTLYALQMWRAYSDLYERQLSESRRNHKKFMYWWNVCVNELYHEKPTDKELWTWIKTKMEAEP